MSIASQFLEVGPQEDISLFPAERFSQFVSQDHDYLHQAPDTILTS
ncbi:hypothetical protein BPC006_I2492 [Burkholderia pseudomallei BPC006]|nr:hypothetical protein BPC006_I2492 [Burkholderia pseudomallei BPC006]EDS86998.1 hypothetical protein BURPSS13_P1061 [Burkholderia pseudomallei S13]EEC35330.1 hypothetical protein BUC_1622 [Burkholderia pseudomallei 576]EEH23881.1 hypothetical protein BUH_2441 [Burkholderia pseudomallei Pakistan 9]